MKRKLYGNNIPPACEYCRVGTLSDDETTILCRKKGIVALSFKCWRFKYDPLKRKPKRERFLEEYKSEDFSL